MYDAASESKECHGAAQNSSGVAIGGPWEMVAMDSFSLLFGADSRFLAISLVYFLHARAVSILPGTAWFTRIP